MWHSEISWSNLMFEMIFFSDLKRLLDEYEENIASKGGYVVRSAEDVVRVAAEIEQSLQPLATAVGDEE